MDRHDALLQTLGERNRQIRDLEAERDRLRAALEVIAEPGTRSDDGCQECPATALEHIARLALDGHLALDISADIGGEGDGS